MAASNDHPGLPFVQARGYTRGRPDGKPLWIVVHDMEAGENSARAESTAAYFANPSDGRQVSSHYCVDDNSVVQCVDLDDSAWTVGNRPGNNRGINWELSGFARQTRAEWLDAFGMDMFRQMAPYVRSDAERFGIPLTRRTVAELKAFRPGVTSHNDLRLAFGMTTHTDPGGNFPWDVFLRIMANEEEEGEDVSRVLYVVESSDTDWDGKHFLSDGIHRRGPLRTKGEVLGPATVGAVRQVLTDALREGEAWETYLTSVAGPLYSAVVGSEHTHDVSVSVSTGGNVTLGPISLSGGGSGSTGPAKPSTTTSNG